MQQFLAADPRTQKRRIDTLFVIHTVFSAIAGAVGFIAPHIFEFFMIHHGEKLRLFGATANDDQKITHEVIRLYAALITAQSWIVWHARQISDPHTRRALVQAYTIAFALTTIALLRAQLTEGGGLNNWNWVNILLFAGLASGYGWFVVFEKVAIFEGLGKGMS